MKQVAFKRRLFPSARGMAIGALGWSLRILKSCRGAFAPNFDVTADY